ncbi:hypothetical protein BCR35DRAFT_355425 [Leucosporidium creatinivorum]|uniref:Uncharacterized protein n=1 Tax=Leucosporidium creatinivorum TaxID=106004 RepID=A0A1Y2DFI3_9BASI|nr:hypothetical protein BCR35DRAFT_355425 [Leucosporidium creatinivorum]
MLTRQALPTLRLAARPAQLGARAQVRHFQVNNVVNNNFPFKYEGASKTKFTVCFWGGMTFAFVVPFVACAYQINKAEASSKRGPLTKPNVGFGLRYAKSIVVEVATLAWRSAFQLGREQTNRTHFLALHFQYEEGKPTLRKSFKLLQADVMNIKEEMGRRQPGHRHVQGLPTESELSGGARRQLEDRIGETVSATMVFVCLNPKTGKQATCTFTDVSVHIKNTWLYDPLKDTKLNPNWELGGMPSK